ncbi:MAG TPA: tRNA (adenosine(37)-N6)-threonylcarbamoyltransferase complex transferase subunit TsaD [Thermoanaerobaculia bacterium]|nr:tRNA (adenosine(37)-N6)-threonylcarbamoyltransferase complex transferase subunit TsaD [Thermoanaerobaculia bacterium]
MLILGIETSCDETSVAILDGDGSVRANLISSQIERHRPYGGVVPEIASREHLEQMLPLTAAALSKAGVGLDQISMIAVTAGPGLIGSLLVGVAAAQGIAYGRGIGLAGINHLEGHIFSPYLRKAGPAIPVPSRFLSLVVSGGHSSIYDVRCGSGQPQIVMKNRTRDDAAGEVFDKVAKFVGLQYPGGPEVEKCARGGSVDSRYDFAIPRFKDDSPDFSFSGLKANAIRAARSQELDKSGDSRDLRLADFCASFQSAICDQLVDRLDRIWDSMKHEADRPAEVVLAGGVAANTALRNRVTTFGQERDLIVRLPDREFCTDNGAMIAFAALQNASMVTDPRRLTARSRMAVGLPG